MTVLPFTGKLFLKVTPEQLENLKYNTGWSAEDWNILASVYPKMPRIVPAKPKK